MRRFFRGFAILLTLLPALAAAQGQSIQPWQPVGPTVSLSVSTTSSNVQLGWVSTGATPPPIAARVCNTGATAASVAFGDSTVVATTANFSIPPGTADVPSCLVLAAGRATNIAAITALSTTTLTISSGSGWTMGSGPGGGGAAGGMVTNASNATLPVARANLQTGFCFDPVAMYGADPTGVAPSSAAFQSAANNAAGDVSAATPAVICAPGGSYKIDATVNLQSPSVAVRGAGISSTIFFPTGNIDVFYAAANPPNISTYFGVSFSDFRCFRTDNPTAGACIHIDHANTFTIDRVRSDGSFINFQIESSTNGLSVSLFGGGSNSTAGSAILQIDSASDALNNAGLHFTNLELFPNALNGYTNGVAISSCDGCQFTNFHTGRGSTAGILLQPARTTDNVDEIQFSSFEVDPSGYSIYCPSQPGGYTGNFGGIIFKAGNIHGATNDGFHNDCAAMYDVDLSGLQYEQIGASAIALTAGADINAAGSRFDGGNNANGGSPMVSIGAATGVRLDGSSYSTGKGAHPVTYNIAITSASADVTAPNQRFANAATGDVSMTSGAAESITTAKSDKVPTCTATGIGATGACAVLGTGASVPAPTNERGFIRLTTAGNGEATNGTIVLTPTYSAGHSWLCQFTYSSFGTGAWGNGATIGTSGLGAATSTGNWFNVNSGVLTALTDAKTYGVEYRCSDG